MIDGTTEHFYTLSSSVPILPEAGAGEVVDVVEGTYVHIANRLMAVVRGAVIAGAKDELDALAHVVARRIVERAPDALEAQLDLFAAQVRVDARAR